MNATSEKPRVGPRTLAGATILQIVPSLREEAAARTAVNVAHSLLQAGARALVAGEGGPLVNELTTTGAEWIPLNSTTANPFKLRGNARLLEQLIAFERIDIVHAHGPGAAWSARLAAAQIAVWLVTTLPDVPTRASGLRGLYASALAQGDRIIAPSNYAAAPIMRRYRLPPEQITIIPRAIDTAAFNIAAVPPGRILAMRESWQIPAGAQAIVVPGRVAPWNGQIILPETARILIDDGQHDLVFVLLGEHETQAKYARALLKRAQVQGVEPLFRLTGHCKDLPAALAAADIVALPAIQPPILGRTVAQAQAMARPVVTTAVGVLPEQIVAPPTMPEDLRTGWIAAPGDASDFARAITLAITLDANAYQMMAARARQFAEYMFSPESHAVATRAVYTSLLARDL